MELRELETFLVLAERLHFGRTGEQLRVSTAQVSKTIARLERQIGAALFDRTSRRVTLTPVGERLRDDVGPALAAIRSGVERAVLAGRHVTGTLRVGFIGAAAGMFVMTVAAEFRKLHPDCEVRIRESQFADGPGGLLRTDEIDLLLATLPVQEQDLVVSPVLIREDRLLAVSARHPFAGRDAISFQDIARTRLLSSPAAVADYWDASLAPQATADGRPVERGPAFGTVQEMLALVGAGQGTYPVPAQASRFYQRPDVAYVPISDATPFEWVLTWREGAETARIRAFAEVARSSSAVMG